MIGVNGDVLLLLLLAPNHPDVLDPGSLPPQVLSLSYHLHCMLSSLLLFLFCTPTLVSLRVVLFLSNYLGETFRLGDEDTRDLGSSPFCLQI